MTERPSLRAYALRIYLKPGELYIASEPAVIETVLGSCVAVTLHCPVLGIGAICHATLPQGGEGDFRYVDTSLTHMAECLMLKGARPETLVAKVFGGADVLAASAAQKSVGRLNVETAQLVLAATGITIVNQDVAGRLGRKLFFFSDSGRAFVKKLASNRE